ncbi:hypothetical protein SLEP1_g30495 [Rubroshorea leprosula]|uniref:FHA domain-containing protein n=1 Tax=Rubroshorea leprosula TaxID=152421 RepID=A0AAV5K8S5_9ROSI|nr:hypothetical protein SLEP1_g30495 [Rubroshorea leprosula]
MVWGLFPVDFLSGEDKYYIFRKGTYKVGRKGCDVIISKDKGVSRIHAEIIVEEMISLNPLESNPSLVSSKVQIKDCSKYGTFVNKNLGLKAKVHELPNKEATLKDGDLVSFGTGNANYRFCYVPFVFYICCSEPFQVNHPIQDKVSSIGASVTPVFGQECTHVLVDRNIPVKDDLLDAIVAKKPFALCSWLEFMAEKSICTEIPSCNSYVPTLFVEGKPVEIVEPKARESCLEGYTFLLEQTDMYNFGERLQALLEVTGANCISAESFNPNSQVLNAASDYGDNTRLLCVIPRGSMDKFDRFNKHSLLSRVNEMELVCAALSGQLDESILMPPSVVVSSSCSSDETVVADSEEEGEAITSIHKTAASVHTAGEANNEVALDYVKKVEISVESPNNESKEKITMSYDATKVEEHHVVSFEGGLTARRQKVDESECGNSDVIYSQDLVIRDSCLPSTITCTTDHIRGPNFKRFRKTNIQSGNSFNNLVPFSKYPYKDSDLDSEEMVKSLEEEKKRKKAEAVAEDLFSNRKAGRQGIFGSLQGLLSRG